MRNWMGNII